MIPKQSDNGASLIMDALLARMSELDRFSDTEGTAARAYLVKYFGDKKWL